MSEKKIIAVIGATGAQGGGLVRAILADAGGGFAARAITRRPDSDKARALAASGAEVVAGDADDGASLERAFAGGHGAFLVTNFWEPFSGERELQQAGAMARALTRGLLVLLGGCAALAALVIVHYERRRYEIAVRTTLGASRSGLIHGLLAELAWVATVGTLAAIAGAMVVLRAIPASSLPGGVDLGRLDLSLDWRVVGLGIVATLLTLVAAAALPVVRFTQQRRANELFAGPFLSASTGTQRLRQALLALLVGATIVVLVTAALFVRAVMHGYRAAAGFDVDHTVFVAVQVVSPSLARPESALAIIGERTARVREALQTLPHVDILAYGAPPIAPEATRRLLAPIHLQVQDREYQLRLGRLAGSPELLAALGVPILVGRELTAADATVTPLPAVVTASLVNRLWPGENPIGQLAMPSWRGGPIQVVGVAADFAFGSLARPADGVVISASSDVTSLGLEPRFVIRTGMPDALVPRIERALAEAVPRATWVNASTGHDIIARDLGRQRLGAWFFSGFGLTSLLLGAGSVFGLVGYVAESQTREFGVRLALGATARDLVRHAAAMALVPVAAGAAAGLLGAALLSRVLASALVGVNPLDPVSFGAVVVMIVSSAGAAAVTAAWRLRGLAPTEALRAN